MSDLDIDETGFAGITLRGEDNVPVRILVDLWEASNHLSAIYNRAKANHPGTEPADRAEFHIEFYSGIVAYLASLGFPKIAHFVADRVYDSITEAANNLGKTPAVEPPLA